MNRVEITEKDLESLPFGTFFKFQTWDNEENTYWTFTYCKSKKGYIYLGGGIDFGTAVGLIDLADKVLEEINNNDFPEIIICNLTEHKQAKGE